MFQNQTILKKANLSTGVRRAAGITALLLNEFKIGVQAIYSIAYNLSKQDSLNNKESIEELIPRILGKPLVKESIEESANSDLTKGSTADRPLKESIEESAGPLSTKKLMEHIKSIYPNNNLAQRIIASKAAGYRKIPAELIKQGI